MQSIEMLLEANATIDEGWTVGYGGFLGGATPLRAAARNGGHVFL